MKQGIKVVKGLAPALLGTVAMVLSVSPAFADLTFYLNTPNTNGTAYSFPYVLVSIHVTDSTHATVDFLGQPGTHTGFGTGTYAMGGAGTVGLNFNGTVAVVGGIPGGITYTQAGTDTPMFSSGNGNEDGFGKFNFALDNFDGFTHRASEVMFNVQNTSGMWALDGSDVLTANSNGNLAAAHVYPWDAGTGGPGNTFYVGGNGGTTPFPPPPASEPGTMLLLGSGLVGLVACRRLRSRA